MKFSAAGFVALVTAVAMVGPMVHATALPDDLEGRKMVQEAYRAIAAYHRGQPKSGAKLRVVYFHPSDRDPLPNYAERLDRVMTDVSDFYRDGLRVARSSATEGNAEEDCVYGALLPPAGANRRTV